MAGTTAATARRRSRVGTAHGTNQPANITVLWEMNKANPNPDIIGRMMKRFVYTAGITGVMQVATLVIMTKVATI